MNRRWFWILLLGTLAVSASGMTRLAPSRQAHVWQVHEPITHSNLALFPVTADGGHDSSGYLTLDEGLRSGEVEITELGAALLRRRPGARVPDRAQVNTLALVNHSKKALVLLAGEIVTGGKQDRVISKDRIVPPGAEPLPLDVFCVEPGRWHGASLAFNGKSVMAALRVRQKAAVAKNQQEVWAATDAVRQGAVREIDTPAARAGLARSSSYAELERSQEFKGRIDRASRDLQSDYERALRGALRGKDVVGVVVAINGEVVWADLFADSDLFRRYWSKLLRSYVVEAMSAGVVEHARASRANAERFLAERDGKQIIEVEPGEYRLVQIDHPRYSIFQLASLVETGQPLLHFNKLRKESSGSRKRGPRPIPVPQPHYRR
ncbi:MAG: ARPP-1 family domain-containing protein [Terriglobia bacterium]